MRWIEVDRGTYWEGRTLRGRVIERGTYWERKTLREWNIKKGTLRRGHWDEDIEKGILRRGHWEEDIEKRTLTRAYWEADIERERYWYWKLLIFERGRHWDGKKSRGKDIERDKGWEGWGWERQCLRWTDSERDGHCELKIPKGIEINRDRIKERRR